MQEGEEELGGKLACGVFLQDGVNVTWHSLQAERVQVASPISLEPVSGLLDNAER